MRTHTHVGYVDCIGDIQIGPGPIAGLNEYQANKKHNRPINLRNK